MGQGIFRTVMSRTVAVCTLLLLSPSVFAYLDPSTGSMVVSVIVGVFATIVLALKAYWYKFKGLFRKKGGPTAGTANRSSNEE